MPNEMITCELSGIDLSEEELDDIWEIYNEGDISPYFTETAVVVARDEDGDIVGAITESGCEELTIGITKDWRDQGMGTAMVKALIASGGGGYMVAGTNRGLDFLLSLYHNLSQEEREALDVPSWEIWEIPENGLE